MTCCTSVADERQVVLPLHPRGRTQLVEHGLFDHPQVRVTDPLGYVQFMGVVSGADAAVTDSGGVQEEVTVLGVPFLTVRPTPSGRSRSRTGPTDSSLVRVWPPPWLMPFAPDARTLGLSRRCGTVRPGRRSLTSSSRSWPVTADNTYRTATATGRTRKARGEEE